MVTAYIGMGSNRHHPRRQLHKACGVLARMEKCRQLRISPFYRSPALGHCPQPAYVNAVASLKTTLPPASLLARLQALELAQGRRRGRRWGARTLDLDLLIWGRLRLRSPELQLPHPRMHLRGFVLKPLADLAPNLRLPGRRHNVRQLSGRHLQGQARRLPGQRHPLRRKPKSLTSRSPLSGPAAPCGLVRVSGATVAAAPRHDRSSPSESQS